MAEAVQIGNATLYCGDCLDVLRTLPDASIEAIVTDPPYGLAFMGKHWDYDVPAVEVWQECLRVLKPGGHLLAFAGTRTFHRMAVRIEDAGFEIRDMIAWVYSSGFPKSMNLDRQKGEVFCGCERTSAQKAECDMRFVRNANVSASVDSCEGRGQILQSGVPEQSAPAYRDAHRYGVNEGAAQSSLEGWLNAQTQERELCTGQVCESARLGPDHGEKGRICDGASSCYGADDWAHASEARNCSSHRPQPDEQFTGEFGALSRQSDAQAMGAWPICGGCGKPRIPSGLGTALKPALEPIALCRKPLTGTVAANVLEHGTGALNVDGCRVESEGHLQWSSPRDMGYHGGTDSDATAEVAPHGRWPANVVLDPEAGAMLDEQSGTIKSPAAYIRSTNVEGEIYGPQIGRKTAGSVQDGYGDSGGASRFFYCAKASRGDRGPGNNHPTVKPTGLMQWLVRLVTPPGGTVLDPFMGSGSTGRGAALEGFRFIGIEREPDYLAIAQARIKAAQRQPDLFHTAVAA